MDFVEVFNISLDLSVVLILVGVGLPLCIVVALSQNTMTCFMELSIRSFCFISVLQLKR